MLGVKMPVDVAASMRPRLITAENARQLGQRAHDDAASMRPRLITAENLAATAGIPLIALLQ